AVLKVQESLSTLEESTAKDISQVKAEIKQVDDKLGPMDARITEQSEAIAKIDETQTKHIETAESRFNDNEALINQLARTIANAESSLAEMGMQLTAEYGNQSVEQLRIKASITRLDTVTANKFQSFAQSIERLNSQYGETQAAIEKMAKTEVDYQGNASSVISFKTAVMYNGQYYDAKMLIGASVKNGQVVTQIGFSADTFGIFNPSSGKLDPAFVVINGQVVISEALINKAMIGSIVVQTDMRSPNYVPGKSGMRIDMQNSVFETNSNKGDYSVIRNSKGDYFKYKNIYIIELGWFL
ncbi:phage tail tip fiber protein, partial [Providencia sp. PROV185]|uniref:phage tail tip fiber protein n=1 Tax=Providencia sp. PROV185 TaxID=2949888 RepID=UPI00234AC4C6